MARVELGRGESIDGLLKRFKKEVIKSGVLKPQAAAMVRLAQ